jgi:hypothetical protein
MTAEKRVSLFAIVNGASAAIAGFLFGLTAPEAWSILFAFAVVYFVLAAVSNVREAFHRGAAQALDDVIRRRDELS